MDLPDQLTGSGGVANVVATGSPDGSLAADYDAVRQRTLALCAPLAIDDYQVQPMDDASPPKWHLAHVTWFFETFLLKPFLPGYTPWHEQYEVLFNSYYNGVGAQYPRPRRGMLSRPTVEEVLAYREAVDNAMHELFLVGLTAEARFRIRLGINHEQQHQELLITDLKYNLGNNPLYPPYHDALLPVGQSTPPLTFTGVTGGIHEIGLELTTDSFAFDNESPRHQVLLQDYALADRLVTNEEYLAFIADDGYRRPELWLSDAWSWIQSGVSAPLYWTCRDGEWFEYTLSGLRAVDPAAPVVHVSGYEADAYARWRGYRLPTEPEWEVAVADEPLEGVFADRDLFHPLPAAGSKQLFGDVWEWTATSYGPYPGFREFAGQLGEYNGKFMANQLVLRGGSCATSRSHIRATYRNFFYPPDRWQFSGIRLAKTG